MNVTSLNIGQYVRKYKDHYFIYMNNQTVLTFSDMVVCRYLAMQRCSVGNPKPVTCHKDCLLI